VLNYYNVCDSTFATVEGSGKIVGNDSDTKKAAKEIKIAAKLSLGEFIKASIDFLLKTIKPASVVTASSPASEELQPARRIR